MYYIIYNRGHLSILSNVEKAAKNVEGLFYGGNYKTGVAFGDCIQYGAEIANDVRNYLKPTTTIV